MFEKMIGVSPPQVGKAQDSKVANAKDFRDNAESKSNYKSDFERALKEKDFKQKKDLEKKNEVAKKEELRADKKDKKSSGGIKKKMTDVDDKMVSNSMASSENVIETPSSNPEEPAMIETDNATLDAKDVKLNEQSFSALEKGALAGYAIEENNQSAVPKVVTEQSTQVLAQTQTQAQEENISLEAELGTAVGFKPTETVEAGNKELLNKIKGFEAEQKLNQKQESLFEKNVLSQLQKDSSFNSSQFSQKDQEGGLEQKDKGDIKAELLGNQMHQAAGQSHSAFKSHLEAAAAPTPQLSSEAQLEAHREDNVNEIMKQAQYLVKQGGGEVSVRMSPEGMGEMHLKVLLQDGKLNVELQTQDKDVKKLIEESLSDLKSGLAAHRLSLEHVKIDTVNATNADNNTQMQSHLNQGGSDGRARDFWSETQNQMNQGSRRELSQERSSGGNSGVALAQPKTSSAQALRTYGGTKGATINRVA